MSIIFAIGIEKDTLVWDELAGLLSVNRFTAIKKIEHPHEHVTEAQNAAIQLNKDVDWFFAMLESGLPDLDFVYEIPREIAEGRLKDIVEKVACLQDFKRLCIFMYDLGTYEMSVHNELLLSEIKETLNSWYKVGGPLGSVYHVFSRD